VHRPAYTLEDQERMSRAENYFACRAASSRRIGARVVEVGLRPRELHWNAARPRAVIAVDKRARLHPAAHGTLPDRNNLHAFACDAGSPAFSDLARFPPRLLRLSERTGAHRGRPPGPPRHGIHSRARRSRGAAGPRLPALYGPIDSNLGHYRRYSRVPFARLADAAGLRIRKVHYMNAIGFFRWWVNSHILRRTAQSERQIEISRPLSWSRSCRVWRSGAASLRQSLFVVLEKP